MAELRALLRHSHKKKTTKKKYFSLYKYLYIIISILYISGLDKDIDADKLNNILKIALMIGDVRLKEELEGVGGDIYILDASVVTAAHLAKISPSAVKKFLICVQVSYIDLFICLYNMNSFEISIRF